MHATACSRTANLRIDNYIVLNSYSSYSFFRLVERNVLAGVMGVLTLLQDILQVTVITSYCIQCSLLSNYLEFISCRVSQNSIDLMDCIKVINLNYVVSYFH